MKSCVSSIETVKQFKNSRQFPLYITITKSYNNILA